MIHQINNKMKNLLLCLALLIWTFDAHTQTCNSHRATTIIHANEIRAQINQRAMFFWDLDSVTAQFQVPYSGATTPSSIFAGSLWLGGKDPNNNVRVTGVDFICSPRDHLGFFQGPLINDKLPPIADLTNWDRFFNVSGYSIINHQADAADGIINDTLPAIFGWPGNGNPYFEKIHGFPLKLGSQGGAHFIEVPGHENGVYEPHRGEYPHVYHLPRDATPNSISWHVFNTAIDQLQSSDPGTPLLAEIQMTFYTMNCNDYLLSRTLFQQFRVTLKGDQPFHDFVFSDWVSPNIRCYHDDYIGSSPQQNTAYAYNQDSIDGVEVIDNQCTRGEEYAYDGVPPVQTITLLNKKMHSFIGYQTHELFHFPPAITDPGNTQEMYKYMKGTWRDDEPITASHSGYNPGRNFDTTKFLLHDPPSLVNGWSAYQNNITSGDFRMLLSHEIDTLFPDQPVVIDVANTFHKTTHTGHLGQVDSALRNVNIIQEYYNDGFKNCYIQNCHCDCVWPGDADNNGMVNFEDAIYIFMAQSHSGPTRTDLFRFYPKMSVIGTLIPLIISIPNMQIPTETVRSI